MLPYRHARISSVLIGIFFCIIAGYAYYEARAYLYGPRITLPTTQTVVHDPIVNIRGKADNVVALYMNGKQIPVTEDGRFEQPYALAVGYNKVLIYATDHYGAGKEENIEIIYEPLIIGPEASSTPSLAPGN